LSLRAARAPRLPSKGRPRVGFAALRLSARIPIAARLNLRMPSPIQFLALHHFRLVMLLLTVTVVSGCATELPEVTHRYEGSVAIRTDKTVWLKAATVEPTGRIEKESTMISANGVLVAVPTGQSFDPRFGRKDQQQLAQHLGEELVRTGIVKSIATANSPTPDETQVVIEFISTEFRHLSRSYIIRLKVTMIDGERRLEREYRVDSSERDNSAEAWNSTAGRHKIKANKLIVERVINDLQQVMSKT
jgi:hypothetical protein